MTDGDRYRIFNATIKADADEKLFRDVRLSTDASEHVIRTLNLISRENLKGKTIDAIWRTEFIDRRVRTAITNLVIERDGGLVRRIAARATGLKPKQVAESLERIRVRFDGLETTETDAAKLIPPAEASKRAAPIDAEKRRLRVTLVDLIQGGILQPQQQLFADYRKQRLEATLTANGMIVFAGKEYASCSAAGEAAKCQVANRKKMATDGWHFWRFIDETGREGTLAYARQQFTDGTTDQ